MIFGKVLGFFSRAKKFLFNRKEFWQSVKQESFKDSLKYCLPLPAIAVILLSFVAGLSFGAFFGVRVGIFSVIFYPLLLAVIFVVSFGLLHLALKVVGGLGKFYETLQVGLYYLLYNFFITILLVLGVVISIFFGKIALVAVVFFFTAFLMFVLFLIFAFLSILEGFSVFHKISKIKVFIVWFVLTVILNIISSALFSLFFGGVL